MQTLKHSRQRMAILHFLQARKDHPNAETVYNCLRTEHPNISLGTVYRNLSLLAEIGEILRIAPGEGPDHFDGNAHPHPHFICTHCKRIMDLEQPDPAKIAEEAAGTYPGIIQSCQVNFYGICEECNQNEKNS